jgi:hypothetical protein
VPKAITAVLLSLFLGPGVGQLYNKEYKKGAYLLGLSFIVFLAGCIWYAQACMPYIPGDLPTLDTEAVRQLVVNAAAQVKAQHGRTIALYKIIFLALWVYSIADAAYGVSNPRPQPQTKK